MEGPFYPDKLPLDTDNDLLIVNDSITPAVGQITYLSGRVLDRRGNPLRNAVVEIWQVDGKGVYLHSGSENRDRRDAHFQGYGRFLTGARGEYCFRTVKPVPYTGVQFVAIPEFQGLGDTVGKIFSAALAGQTSVDDALKQAQDVATRVMTKGGYIK